jgi:NAD-dependent deacetylase
MAIVALTGAGISAESGVPTFRGAAGMWRDHRPEELATPAAFRRDPHMVWEFYAWRRDLVSRCEPNEAHKLLAQLQLDGLLQTIITQNVDGLHQRAGSTDVIELHGSLWKLKCSRCENKWTSTETPLPTLPPHCHDCGAIARPDVVWFGESLDPQVLQAAYHVVRNADVLLVIGTSALVYPAAGLPQVAKDAQANIVEINPQETPVSSFADEVYREPATEGLKMWWRSWKKSN